MSYENLDQKNQLRGAHHEVFERLNAEDVLAIKNGLYENLEIIHEETINGLSLEEVLDKQNALSQKTPSGVNEFYKDIWKIIEYYDEEWPTREEFMQNGESLADNSDSAISNREVFGRVAEEKWRRLHRLGEVTILNKSSISEEEAEAMRQKPPTAFRIP